MALVIKTDWKTQDVITPEVFNRVEGNVRSLESLISGLDNDKVDKVSGKGLSTHDFTTTYRNKINTNESNISDLETNKLDVSAFTAGNIGTLLAQYSGEIDATKLGGQLPNYYASVTYVNDRVKTPVPSEAEFTDTKTTINGKTGIIKKADIVALGIPAQDTVYTHPTSAGWKHIPSGGSAGEVLEYDSAGTAKWSDGFMPKKGGQLETYTEKLITLGSGTIDLNSGNTFQHSPSIDTTYSITGGKNGAHSFTLIINQGATPRVLTFPSSVRWREGEVPEMNEANKDYILTFLSIDSGATWYGMSGGEF